MSEYLELKEFIKQIELPEEAGKIVETLDGEMSGTQWEMWNCLFDSHREEFFVRAEKLSNYRQFFLWFYCRKACEVFPQYQKKGISEEIFRDTFSDITLWCQVCKKRHGEYGLQEYGWLWRHPDMSIFRLGRLQFERMGAEWEFSCQGKMINKGTPVISIHIPEGTPLYADECEESFRKGMEFWGDDYVYLCHSWLLYPQLSQLLQKNSNILRFQKYYDIIRTDYEFREGEERIFGCLQSDPSAYPENTSLQKAAKKFLCEGGKLGSGLGILKKSALP